jgi:hypothetical protein
MANKAQLANINFSKNGSPKDKEVINKVSQFKLEEGKDEVCTSLEDWTLLILKPTLNHANNSDEESEKCYKRTFDMRPIFFISNLDFSKEGGHWQAKSAGVSLNTYADRFNNMPKNELVWNVRKLITELVTKVDKK